MVSRAGQSIVVPTGASNNGADGHAPQVPRIGKNLNLPQCNRVKVPFLDCGESDHTCASLYLMPIFTCSLRIQRRPFGARDSEGSEGIQVLDAKQQTRVSPARRIGAAMAGAAAIEDPLVCRVKAGKSMPSGCPLRSTPRAARQGTAPVMVSSADLPCDRRARNAPASARSQGPIARVARYKPFCRRIL